MVHRRFIVAINRLIMVILTLMMYNIVMLLLVEDSFKMFNLVMLILEIGILVMNRLATVNLVLANCMG